MRSNKKIDIVKNAILDILPESISKRIFLIRHKDSLFTKQLKSGDKLEVIVPNTMLEHYKGGHELGVEDKICRLAPKIERFYDVGSCYGYYSAMINSINPKVEINTFEPFWGHYIYLEKNIKKYQKNNWSITKKLISDKVDDKHISLDSYAQKNNSLPTLIKIDVDGNEIGVIEGMTEIIKQKKTHFLIEVLTRNLPSRNREGMIHFIHKYFGDQYNAEVLIHVHKNDTKWEDVFNGNIPEEIDPSIGDIYFYFFPKEGI